MAPTLADSLSTPPCGEECRLLVHKVYTSSYTAKVEGVVLVYISEMPALVHVTATCKGMYRYTPPQRVFGCYYSKSATD